MDKIYSRTKIRLPSIKTIKPNNRKISKIYFIVLTLIISTITVYTILKLTDPIFEGLCVEKARRIATDLTNRKSSEVLAKYNYQDTVKIIKSEDEKNSVLKTDIVTLNQIISEIAIEIQNELDDLGRQNVEIPMGALTGSQYLAGSGPKIKIRIISAGNIITDIRTEFKATGIGLNEAAVQYITSKIEGKKYEYIEKYEVVAKTYNEQRYPLMCNLILQLIYVTGENIFLDSILNCKNDFEYKIMENCGEGTYTTIINGLDKMLYAEEENIQLFQFLEKHKQTSNANTDYATTEQEIYKTMAKIEANRKIIKETYIKLENLILNSYFNKYFSRIETLDDIIAYRKDLYNYKEIYGMNSFDNEYNKYYSNKIKDLEDKRINIMRKTGQFSLAKTDNKILNNFSKIRAALLGIFKRNIQKEENR